MSARDGLRRRALVLVLSSLGVLLAAEIAARLLLGERFRQGELLDVSWRAVARFDEDFGWAQRPGARAHVLFGDIDYRVAIGADGWRDRPRTRRPAPGTRRIVLLGDSMSWGWAVEQDQRFSELLEARLSGAGEEVEVVNRAVPGYGTDQELRLLEEQVLSLEPEIVLLGFVLNDVVDAQRLERYGMRKPAWRRDEEGAWRLEGHPVPPASDPGRTRLRELDRLARSTSALAAGLVWRRELRRLPAQLGELEGEALASIAEGRASPELVERLCGRIDDPERVTGMLLERLAERCRSAGVRLIAFSLPHNHDVHLYRAGVAPPEGRARDEESLLSRSLASAGRRFGFETVSIDGALAAAAAAGLDLDCGDGHYDARGNALVAETLAPALARALAELGRGRR